jgi:hypothetical protein
VSSTKCPRIDPHGGKQQPAEIAAQAGMTGLSGSRSIQAPAQTPMMTQGIQAMAQGRLRGSGAAGGEGG